MNKVFLIGNLTRDPEMRESTNGFPVCNFTIAVNKRTQKDHPESDFFRVTAWRQTAENCGKYLSKGKKVCVVGEVHASAYIGNDGGARASLEVTADSVEFLSPKGQNAKGGELTDENGYVRVDNEELPEFGRSVIDTPLSCSTQKKTGGDRA